MIYDLLRPRMIQTLALLLAISYVGVAARRWRPAMLFDAAMLALLLWRPYPALLAFVLWLIGVRWIAGWSNWVALAFQLDTFPGHTAALARFLLPAWGGAATRSVMSGAAEEASKGGVAPPVDQHPPGAKQPIAITGNTINMELPATTELPESARDIMRFQAKVETLAALIKAGQVTNMAKGIEQAFGCARSSKEDSTYQRARRALDPLLQNGPLFADDQGQLSPPTYPVTGGVRK